MSSRRFFPVVFLGAILGSVGTLPAAQPEDRFIGKWKTQAKFAGYDQVILIDRDGAQWSIKGTFEKDGAEVGTFIAENVGFADGQLTYRSHFVKKPVEAWQDNDTALRLEGDALMMKFVARTGETIVRPFERIPPKPKAADTTNGTASAKPESQPQPINPNPVDSKPAEHPTTPHKNVGADNPGSLLTRENYDKVQPGMTTDEVKAILGRNQSSAGSGADWTLTWRVGADRAHHIEVHFKDGKVSSNHSTMAWGKPAKPEEAPAKDVVPASRPAPPPAADPIDTHLAQLRDREPKKRRSALSWFAKAEFDEARAPEVSKAIEPHLKEKDMFIHSEAVSAIRKWATRENSAYFIHVVSTSYDARDSTKTPENMDLAIEMLVKLRDPDGVAPIAKLMRKFFNRRDAVEALKKLGPELAQQEVLKYANDKSPDVALAAKEVLDSFKTGSGARLDQCLADLKSKVLDKRVFAARQIATIPVDPPRRMEVAAALEAMIQEKTGRGEALPAMAKWGGPENEPALIKLLSDQDALVRQVTCQTLGAMGTRQSLPSLQKATTDRNAQVAAAAKQAVDAISKRGK